MRILQLIQKKQLRGAEIFACQLSDQLIDYGHQVMIVALLDGNSNMPTKASINVLEANLSRRFYDFKAWRRLAKVIKLFNPEIVQANASDTLKYAFFSKFFYKWKQPIVFRNASVMSNYMGNSFTRLFNSILLRSVNHIVSVCSYAKNDLIDQFKISRRNISVIPVGVNFISFSPFQMDSARMNIVHIGGFSFEKNHLGLLRIFTNLLSSFPNTRLWLIGDGKLINDVKERALESGIANAINFTGNVSNPLDYIAAADVLVLPSIIEGLPAVILEAFYCRTTVVAYNTGGVSEILTERTGWLVTKDDENQFTSTLEYVLKNRNAIVEEKISNAYILVLKNYSANLVARRFESLYSQLL